MAKYKLTAAADTVTATDRHNAIFAPGDSLTHGDIITAPAASDTRLVLEHGNRFNLAAPATLRGISVVDDRSVGNSVITLRQGLNLTLQLGAENATVYGAANADTILATGGGYDTIVVADAREHVIAGPVGASVTLDASACGAQISGGGNSVLTLTGAPHSAARLGIGVTGIAELDLTHAAMTVDATGAGIATVALSATSITLNAGTARLVTDYAGGNSIRFTHQGQTLRLPDTLLAGRSGEAPDHLLNFAVGDMLDIDLPSSKSETVHYAASTGLLTVSEGPLGAAQSIYLAGAFHGTFQLTPDMGLPSGDYGTAVRFVPAGSSPPAPPGTPACFAAGTRVRTARGLVGVEHIRLGDRLVTARGAYRPLRWIGRQRLDCRTHPNPAEVHPIRILAGAFAPDLPQRDVLLSPDHALYLNGVLIPVKYLLNGATIRQEAVAEVRYFHLELNSHDAILAENLPVESYLDTGNRHLFQGTTPPRSVPAPRRWFAPLHTNGPEIGAIRTALLNRAGRLGYAMTHDADLHLRVDGQRIWGRIADGVWSGWVPPGARHIEIISRAAAPADCDPIQDDRRRLGVAIRRIDINWTHGRRQIDARTINGPGLHPPESNGTTHWRWTNGAATLPTTHWSDLTAPFRLDLHLTHRIAYRLEQVTALA